MMNQICIAGIVQGLAEALNFGQRTGLDMEKVISAISKGAAQCWQMDNRWKAMGERQVRGLRLRRRLDAQGLGISMAEGKQSNGAACRSPRWSTSSMPACRSAAASAGTAPRR